MPKVDDYEITVYLEMDSETVVTQAIIRPEGLDVVELAWQKTPERRITITNEQFDRLVEAVTAARKLGM